MSCDFAGCRYQGRFTSAWTFATDCAASTSNERRNRLADSSVRRATALPALHPFAAQVDLRNPVRLFDGQLGLSEDSRSSLSDCP